MSTARRWPRTQHSAGSHPAVGAAIKSGQHRCARKPLYGRTPRSCCAGAFWAAAGTTPCVHTRRQGSSSSCRSLHRAYLPLLSLSLFLRRGFMHSPRLSGMQQGAGANVKANGLRMPTVSLCAADHLSWKLRQQVVSGCRCCSGARQHSTSERAAWSQFVDAAACPAAACVSCR